MYKKIRDICNLLFIGLDALHLTYEKLRELRDDGSELEGIEEKYENFFEALDVMYQTYDYMCNIRDAIKEQEVKGEK